MSNNFDLPPIRKIGPAVAPKPKNIKIQAGRVIRLNESDLNNNEFNYHQPHYIFENNLDFPLPPPPLELINDDSYSQSNSSSSASFLTGTKNGGSSSNSDSFIDSAQSGIENSDFLLSVPHRARLVKVEDLGNYDANNQNYITNINMRKNQPSPPSSPLPAPPTPIVSTSQFRFPRKHSSSGTQSTSPSLPPPPMPPPPPPLIMPSDDYGNNDDQYQPFPSYNPPKRLPTTFDNRSNDDDSDQYILTHLRKFGGSKDPKSTLTVSSDGSLNSPTITITARSPNAANINFQPQIIEGDLANGFTYNIPIQHIQQQQQIQLQPHQIKYQPSSPTAGTLFRNFIITPQQDNGALNGNGISVNTNSNGDHTYTVPVNLQLSNGNQSNTISVNSSYNGSGNSNNISNGNGSSNGHLNDYNEGGFNIRTNFLTSNGNSGSPPPSSNIYLTNNTNKPQINNFKTLVTGNKYSNGNPGLTTSRSEDEVDLLKDLLVKNLHASSDPKFCGICARCNENIIGAETGLRAMENLYHVACFNCTRCACSLQGKHFYAMDNKSYCESCYMSLLERCTLCSRPITDRILRATGKPFHPECFCCVLCEKNLDGIPFTVDASNRIHCIECFHEKYAPRCYICSLPITPEQGQEETVRIVAMDKSFHVKCYKCEDCGISLSSNAENVGGCFPLDDHIYCKNCNIQRIRKLTNNSQMVYTPLITKLGNGNSSPSLMAQGITPRSTDL